MLNWIVDTNILLDRWFFFVRNELLFILYHYKFYNYIFIVMSIFKHMTWIRFVFCFLSQVTRFIFINLNICCSFLELKEIVIFMYSMLNFLINLMLDFIAKWWLIFQKIEIIWIEDCQFHCETHNFCVKTPYFHILCVKFNGWSSMWEIFKTLKFKNWGGIELSLYYEYVTLYNHSLL